MIKNYSSKDLSNSVTVWWRFLISVMLWKCGMIKDHSHVFWDCTVRDSGKTWWNIYLILLMVARKMINHELDKSTLTKHKSIDSKAEPVYCVYMTMQLKIYIYMTLYLILYLTLWKFEQKGKWTVNYLVYKYLLTLSPMSRNSPNSCIFKCKKRQTMN